MEVMRSHENSSEAVTRTEQEGGEKNPSYSGDEVIGPLITGGLAEGGEDGSEKV